MKILGIETSCDDTSAAVVRDGRAVITSVVSSQTLVHRRYGGIVPELASRKHVENINYVVSAALEKAGRIDAVAVTSGPGLIGSLLVGITTARVTSSILGIPVVPVNHIEGHIFDNYLYPAGIKKKPALLDAPFLALVVSGGHTDLILIRKTGRYEVLGRTRDDAVGEVFDKIAKHLGLGYPGGSIIDKLARTGDPDRFRFTRPYLPGSWDFSFSGVKTAVVNFVNGHKLPAGRKSREIADICASFQQCCVDVLVRKTLAAAKKYKIGHIAIGGGVSANSRLRKCFSEECARAGISLNIPPSEYCTDNAAMIAAAGFYKLEYGVQPSVPAPCANLELENWKRKKTV
jgi:N6-L-threonylcarbamoyladenine synthase